MNWLLNILFYVLNIRNEEEEDIIKVQKAFLLENNFWCVNQEQPKTDKGYLYRVNIDVEQIENEYITSFHYYFKTCFFLKSTNLGYFLPEYLLMDDINTFLESLEFDKFLLRFSFLFTDEPIDSLYYLEEYKGKLQEYVTYKSLEKRTKNSVELRCNLSTNIRMKHIKERFEIFLSMKLLKFNEYIKNVVENELEKGLRKIKNSNGFNLFYFKDYSECFKSLENFIKDLCYYFPEDDASESSLRMSVDKINTLKVLQFRNRLYRKCYESFKKLNETDKSWKPLLNDCCEYIEYEMLNNNIFFPIGGKYDIDFYIEELSNFIYELVERIRREFDTSNVKNKILIFHGITCSLKNRIKELQLAVSKDLCESEYVLKLFFKKEIKTFDDCIKIENMLCDFHNAFVYVFNNYHTFNDEDSYVSYSYCLPIFIDNYNLRIVDGIKIELNSIAKLGYIIRGFDDKRNDCFMEKDIDYFVDENILYSPSEVLKLKNIQEIEVISFDNKEIYKRFQINKYLSSN